MWQPSGKQWGLIWPVALLAVLAWPPDSGKSLGMKLVNYVVDPRGTLPPRPVALPMNMDDDGDAVTEHDMLESAYLHAREQSAVTRYRLDLRDAGDPLERSTQRQVLVGLVVAGALLVWRMDAGRAAPR